MKKSTTLILACLCFFLSENLFAQIDTCYCNLEGEYNAVTSIILQNWDLCNENEWEGKVVLESTENEVYKIYSRALDSMLIEDPSWGYFYACFGNLEDTQFPGGNVRLVNDCVFSYTGTNQWGETYSILEYAFNEKNISIKWLSDYGEAGHTILTPVDERPISDYICDIIISNKEINHLENWTIHPNPVSKNTLLNIDLTLSESTNIEVVIIDVLGNIIYTQESKVNSGANRLDLSLDEFSAGIYLVKISDEKGQTVKKVIIN